MDDESDREQILYDDDRGGGSGVDEESNIFRSNEDKKSINIMNIKFECQYQLWSRDLAF